ncbi:PcfJ domain-containing protein [Butyrivibrio sp.]|uniref:PcfJ domain-containing protein n=1 Tax=Butyrivibrio sp. TaxID=28121 RepID=UPI0025C5F453|nr:PcfJ domain-containing protein [Butyrivibrio sp.]MBQ9303101.1 PcfJ domain-containing protein [Butyrivibrio sp.]
MRKGQMQLLERAQKISLNPEQLQMLSREDLKLETIADILRIFEAIHDFPADKAYEYVRHGGHSYDLWTGDKVHLTYKEYLSLPDGVKDNSDAMHTVRVLRAHIQDINESFYETAKWYLNSFDENHELDLYSLPELISDKRFTLKYCRNSSYYSNDWKLDRDTLVYYIHFFSALMKMFVKQWQTDLATLLLAKAQKHLEEDYGTERELKHRQDEYDRINHQQLRTSEYIDFLKEKCHGKIYVQKYIDSSISVQDAAQAVMDSIMTEEKTFAPKKVEDFYDLFRDYENFEYTEYQDEQEKRDVEYIRQKTHLTGSLNIRSTRIAVSVPKEIYEGKPVFIDFAYAKNLTIQTDNDGKRIIYIGYTNTDRLIIYEDGAIYIKKWGKYQKAPVRDVVSLFHSHHGMKILDKILEIPVIKESYVFKDLVKDCTGALIQNQTFPSLLWNTCIGYKNRNQLMKALYKNTEGIDFNKMGIPCGYAYMKTRPYVNERSQGILYNAFTNHDITGYLCKNAKKQNAVAQAVVFEYLTRKLNKLYPDRQDVIPIEVRDYVTNTLDMKQKLNLRWRSLTKMTQQNIDTVLAHQNDRTAKIIVPKNSVFNDLAAQLPSDFERIRSKKRIILEGRLMRHCVASYADYVNKDQCAIYHLTYFDRGYTLEFRIIQGKYRVVQIQSKVDRGAPKEVWNYVQELIKDIPAPKNDKKKQKKSA